MVELLSVYRNIWESQFIDTKELAEELKISVEDTYKLCRKLSDKSLVFGEEQQHSHFGSGVITSSGIQTRNRKDSLVWSLPSVDVSWEEALKSFRLKFPYRKKTINVKEVNEKIESILKENKFEFIKNYSKFTDAYNFDLWQYGYIEEPIHVNLGIFISVVPLSDEYIRLKLGYALNYKENFEDYEFEKLFEDYSITTENKLYQIPYHTFDEFFKNFVDSSVEFFNKYFELAQGYSFVKSYDKFKRMSRKILDKLLDIQRSYSKIELDE